MPWAEIKGFFHHPEVTLSLADYDRFRCEKNIRSPVAPVEQQVYGVISAQRIRIRRRTCVQQKIPRKNTDCLALHCFGVIWHVYW
jgi:hypothetical protein